MSYRSSVKGSLSQMSGRLSSNSGWTNFQTYYWCQLRLCRLWHQMSLSSLWHQLRLCSLWHQRHLIASDFYYTQMTPNYYTIEHYFRSYLWKILEWVKVLLLWLFDFSSKTCLNCVTMWWARLSSWLVRYSCFQRYYLFYWYQQHWINLGVLQPWLCTNRVVLILFIVLTAWVYSRYHTETVNDLGYSSPIWRRPSIFAWLQTCYFPGWVAGVEQWMLTICVVRWVSRHNAACSNLRPCSRLRSSCRFTSNSFSFYFV